MTIKEVEAARERLDAAVEAVVTGRNAGTIAAVDQAEAEFRRVGLAYAESSGEEYAVGFDFEPPWSAGAPLPHMIASANVTWLIYLVREPASEFIQGVDPTSAQERPLAAVEFRGVSFRFGSPNDEVIHGHPLYERGLEAYHAHIVHNSRWIQEIERTNSVHGGYRPDAWRDLKHYLLLFHDETFECIARDYRVETYQRDFAGLLKDLADRLW